MYDYPHANRPPASMRADVRQHVPLVSQTALQPLLESSNLVTSNPKIPKKQNVWSVT